MLMLEHDVTEERDVIDEQQRSVQPRFPPVCTMLIPLTQQGREGSG